MNNRRHRAVWLAHRQHADNLSVVDNRCGDVHHGALRIVRVNLRATRTIVATQRKPDIVPARIIFAERFAGRIEHHPALCVRHVNMIFVAHFMDPANVGAKRTLMKLRESLRQPAIMCSA
ncbi:hypothetical protein D3C80_1165170 [compost metagenome]